LFEELLAGFAAGFTGLFAFLHVNFLLQVFQPFFPAGFSKAVFASALTFSKTVFETIPTVFFIVPSASFGAALLPSQKLFLEGKGFFALKILIHSMFFAMVFSILSLPLVFLSLPFAFSLVKPVAGFALALIVLLSLASKERLFETVLVFSASGLVGLVVLTKPLVAEPLFPLLSGLFGIPALFFAFNASLPKAQAEAGAVKIGLKTVFAGVLLGAFSGVLPALTPAFLISMLFLVFDSTEKEKTFLEASAAVVVSKNFFDFASFFLIGKARSGAVAFASEELSVFPNLLAALIAASIALFAALAVVSVFSRLLSGIRPGKLFFVSIAAFVSIASFVLGGGAGLAVLATASALGLACGIIGVNKSSLMGCLIIPSLCFFFGIALF